MTKGNYQSKSTVSFCAVRSLQVRISLIAARRPYSMSFPSYAIIVLIVIMILMSALFSGLNLSFTSVAISELNIIIRMGDAYVSFCPIPLKPIHPHQLKVYELPDQTPYVF